MRTRRLFNTSEYKTGRILESGLQGTGFRVYPELMLSKVLDIDREPLSKKERQTLNRGSFDFVVYNEDSHPEFAVEFDGPHHQIEEDKKQSDVRKNLLCFKAGLPLLRISDEFLTKYEKTSLLEYVVIRFVAWRNERDKISQEESEIAEYLAERGASEEEYEQMRDPQIMWDLAHPFPASIEISERLYSTYGIVSSHIDSEVYERAYSQLQFLLFQRNGMGSKPIGLDHYSIERSYELNRMTRHSLGKYELEHVHILKVAVTYQWKLPTVDRRPFRSGKCQLLLENAHGQEVPGISMSELADHFCDFLALNKLRECVTLPKNRAIEK
jgi:very-short-patch-repair endonuclease